MEQQLAHAVVSSSPDLLSKEVLAVVCFALTGWNAYLQVNIRKISALFKWKDEVEKDIPDRWAAWHEKYSADRLQDVQLFATKGEVKDAVDRIDAHLSSVKRDLLSDIGGIRKVVDRIATRGKREDD